MKLFKSEELLKHILTHEFFLVLAIKSDTPNIGDCYHNIENRYDHIKLIISLWGGEEILSHPVF